MASNQTPVYNRIQATAKQLAEEILKPDKRPQLQPDSVGTIAAIKVGDSLAILNFTSLGQFMLTDSSSLGGNAYLVGLTTQKRLSVRRLPRASHSNEQEALSEVGEATMLKLFEKLATTALNNAKGSSRIGSMKTIETFSYDEIWKDPEIDTLSKEIHTLKELNGRIFQTLLGDSGWNR